MCKTTLGAMRLFLMKDSGCKTEDEYCELLSCYRGIEKIKIPLLIVQSKADPICDYTACPLEDLKRNENCITLMVNCGGHVSFYSGLNKRLVSEKKKQYFLFNSRRSSSEIPVYGLCSSSSFSLILFLFSG